MEIGVDSFRGGSSTPGDRQPPSATDRMADLLAEIESPTASGSTCSASASTTAPSS
jgi:hypothetical protein